MCNSSQTKIYPCYAEEVVTSDSPFHGLVEAQRFYNNKHYQEALSHVDQIINKCRAKALEQQQSLEEYPWISREDVFKYKELNAVGIALFMKGLIYYRLNDFENAEKYLNEQIRDYTYAQGWNPDGWFVKPAEEARVLLERIDKEK